MEVKPFRGKHYVFIIIIIVLVSIFAVVYHNTLHGTDKNQNEKYNKSNKETISAFDFDLPEGFSLKAVNETECSIISDDTVVGGFILTNLNSDIIRNPDEEIIVEYLAGTVPSSMKYEYMMGWAEDDSSPIEVGFYIYDPDTNEGKEYTHYLFKKDDKCYDLWLDKLLVDGETMCEILIVSGVDPLAE